MNGLLKTLSAACVAALCLSGCVYRMPIQQGNYIDPKAIEQVKPGMTRSQVRFLLGTPMTPVAFDNSRWDYDYFLKARRLRTPAKGHATVYFKEDVVDRVDSSVAKQLPTAVSERSVSAPEP
ncbi:MAG: outer membrane protein assembly factor BamE [Steroidobacteraceae bacterium]